MLIEGPFGIRRCIARDVSSRGLFVETADPYPPGCEVHVTFSLPDGTWEMSARCIVRHVARVDASSGMLLGVGLSFEDGDEGPTLPARREQV